MITLRTTALVTLAMALTMVGGCKFGQDSKEAALRVDDKVLGHYVRGRLLYADGDLEAALAELAMAIETDPTLATAHATIGDIFRKKQDYSQAVHAYERACEANPYNFRNHYNCGTLHQILAKSAKMLADTQKHLRRAVAVYLRAVALNAEDYDAKLNLGVCYFRLGSLKEAEEYGKAAIKVAPELPFAYTNLGAVYEMQEKYFDAAGMYTASLERKAEQPTVEMNLAHVHVKQGKYNLAIDHYAQAAKLDPLSAEPIERIGYCYFFKQDHNKAIEQYHQALAMEPRFSQARRGLGVIYMTQFLLDKKRLDLRDKALAEWKISLEIDPQQPKLAQLVDKYIAKPDDTEE